MICVRTSDDWFEIHILAGLLEADGIPCAVLHAGMVRMDWTMAQALGGYRLAVQPAAADAAFALLADYERGALASEGAAACPRCESGRVVRINSPARRAGMTSLLFLPLLLLTPLFAPWRKDRLRCRACGHDSVDELKPS